MGQQQFEHDRQGSVRPGSLRSEARAKGSPLFPSARRCTAMRMGGGDRSSGWEREVIDVVFATGKKATYLSRFADLDRIGGE